MSKFTEQAEELQRIIEENRRPAEGSSITSGGVIKPEAIPTGPITFDKPQAARTRRAREEPSSVGPITFDKPAPTAETSDAAVDAISGNTLTSDISEFVDPELAQQHSTARKVVTDEAEAQVKREAANLAQRQEDLAAIREHGDVQTLKEIDTAKKQAARKHKLTGHADRLSTYRVSPELIASSVEITNAQENSLEQITDSAMKLTAEQLAIDNAEAGIAANSSEQNADILQGHQDELKKERDRIGEQLIASREERARIQDDIAKGVIKPGEVFGKSPLRKIGLAISAALYGGLQARGRIQGNPALDIISKTIDREVAASQKEHQGKLEALRQNGMNERDLMLMGKKLQTEQKLAGLGMVKYLAQQQIAESVTPAKAKLAAQKVIDDSGKLIHEHNIGVAKTEGALAEGALNARAKSLAVQAKQSRRGGRSRGGGGGGGGGGAVQLSSKTVL